MSMAEAPPGALSSTEILAACPGLTYRMLDYWCRTGQLGPQHAEHLGSGVPRRFEPDVIPMIRAALLLSAFGLNADARRNAMARVRTAITNHVHRDHPDGALTFDPDGYPADTGSARLVVPLAALIAS